MKDERCRWWLKCKDNLRITWAVLVYCKIYSMLRLIRTAGQPVGKEGLYYMGIPLSKRIKAKKN